MSLKDQQEDQDKKKVPTPDEIWRILKATAQTAGRSRKAFCPTCGRSRKTFLPNVQKNLKKK